MKPANQRKKGNLEKNTEVKDGTVLNTAPAREVPVPGSEGKENWRQALGANVTTPKGKVSQEPDKAKNSSTTYQHLADQNTIEARNLKEVIGNNVVSKNKKKKSK